MSTLEKERKGIPKTFYIIRAESSIFKFGGNIDILGIRSSCARMVKPSTLSFGLVIAVFVHFPISFIKIPSIISDTYENYSNNVYEMHEIHEYLIRIEWQLQALDIVALE